MPGTRESWKGRSVKNFLRLRLWIFCLEESSMRPTIVLSTFTESFLQVVVGSNDRTHLYDDGIAGNIIVWAHGHHTAVQLHRHNGHSYLLVVFRLNNNGRVLVELFAYSEGGG